MGQVSHLWSLDWKIDHIGGGVKEVQGDEHRVSEIYCTGTDSFTVDSSKFYNIQFGILDTWEMSTALPSSIIYGGG